MRRPTSLCVWLPVLGLLWHVSPALAGEKAAYDSNGRIISLLSSGEDLAVTSNVVAVLPSGKRIPLQVRGPSAGTARPTNDNFFWAGWFTLPDGAKGSLGTHSMEDATSVRYLVSVTPNDSLDVDRIELVLDIPRASFLNGQLTADGAPGDLLQPIRLGPVKPLDSTFFRGKVTAVHLQDADSVRTLDISFHEPQELALTDRWDAAGRSFQVRIPFKHGLWTASGIVVLQPTLRLTEKPTILPPAHLTVDLSNRRFVFQGFGGNYCWDNRSPIAAYTLDHLKVAWARTAMKLVAWDKERENPGPELRADLNVMRRLQKMSVPTVISVWSLPERFYTDPNEKSPNAFARAINPEKWEELLGLIGDYLQYAKREYGVEPELFSFNEANIGINIGLSPEAHARAIARIGAHFQKLGLKTKMLLGDTAGPRDTHTYALAAAADPAAMNFVGAVAFHSWGGGSREQYSAWGDLAEWLNLPLLITEMGVDPSAYFTRAWDSYDYGLREARMMQELLAAARPQAMLFWQNTDDYALARVRPDGTVEPSARFWIMKHFSDLTPAHSDGLAANSDQSSVLITAFRGGHDIALHILNTGASRSVEVTGVSDGEWTVLETTEDAQYRPAPVTQSKEQRLTLELPARSLVTLTGHAP
jgi:hypothetical protein